jgi:hypothetical protein
VRWRLLLGLAALAAMPAMAEAADAVTFRLIDHGGEAMVQFDFPRGTHRGEGLLMCRSGHRLLVLIDSDDSVPQPLHEMKASPAEFTADGKAIGGAATYFPRNAQMPPMVFFDIPLLDGPAFSGSGLALSTVANPSPGEAKAWADAVAAFRFEITASNGEQTMAKVFGDCRAR